MAKKKPLNSTKLLRQVDQEIWPMERDLMVRPDRYKYVRKLVRPKTCVFCSASKAKASVKSLKVFETKYSMVVLNKYPYNSGHILVLPKSHGGDLMELSPDRYEDLMLTLRLATQVVKKVYGCTGLNIGLNHGAVAGAGIPDHLHWHIIPRWFGDVNFFPMIAETKVIVEATATTYSKLLKGFKQVGNL